MTNALTVSPTNNARQTMTYVLTVLLFLATITVVRSALRKFIR